MERIIAEGLAELGLSPAPAGKLEEYGRLLIEGGRSLNLTAITEPEAVARLHMLDCAAVAGLTDLRGKSVIDVGTGAGFPGLVLKLVEPSIQLTLLDAREKRLEWLADTAAALGVEGVSFLHGRAEERARTAAHRERYDAAVSRAVAPFSLLCELCLPLVRVDGLFLAMKGPEGRAEAEAGGRAIERLGGRLRQILDYAIPGQDAGRQLIIVEKAAATPERFPRRYARAKRDPL